MRIPPRLSDLLQKDDRLDAAIHHAISVVKPWFEDNKLVFFPEYTDHGPTHIQEVFETAESLIVESAWATLRPEDVATLILGIILHDCAMHISEDGFVNLISDDSRPLNEDFKDRPWPQLWDDFMTEAKRFDERKLKALFDDVEPVRPPAIDPLKMTRRDRLLIGEFLRRYHPRLAHEIALTGVPGPPHRGLSLGDIPQNIKELAGVVARSHGLDLRVSVDYLNHKSRWGARRATGVHVTYLMTLVRIADYLQIHSSRAPQEVLQVRSLKSPVSRGEWNAHASIKDIHQETDDPEALWIEAAPTDVHTYLKLKFLISDIQRELDESWAVLGEVYGPKEELRGLGIKLRRIKSNLQDPTSFAKNVTYIPCHAALQTAGVDLLKLLIIPLYGNRPEIGIRELLQNALDACLELDDYLSKHINLPALDIQLQSADVVIAVEEKDDGTKWVRVSDRGIGMTIDTVLNYFLKAGASFRNSYAWRMQHAGEQAQSQVLRSGRFGIGVLAGFLLGDEINVSTRHVTAAPNEGIKFACRLEDEAIQLNHTTRPVGTTITIKIPEITYDELNADQSIYGSGINWDWYCLGKPSVHRLILPKGKRLRQQNILPSANTSLPPKWRRIRHSDYYDIHWSFTAKAPELTCNGIIIGGSNKTGKIFHESHDLNEKFSHWGLNYPNLSIFDSQGNLPLNLQRTGLSSKQFSFDEALIDDICRDVLSYLMVYTPTERPYWQDLNDLIAYKPTIHHPGVDKSAWFWFSHEGLALLDSWHIQQLQPSKLFIRSSDAFNDVIGADSFQPFIYYQPDPRVPDLQDPQIQFDIILDELVRRDTIGWIRTAGCRILITQNLFMRLQRLDRFNHGQFEHFCSRSPEWRNNTWILFGFGDCPENDLRLDKLPLTTRYDQNEILAVLYPSQQAEEEDNPLTKAWREIIGLPYIPYDKVNRHKQLAAAYERLASKIKAWVKIASKR